MTRKLDYLVFDADNHMYEATDAFTKYLPDEYAGVIKYVEVNGRTKIAIKNKISDYIPNPTFNKVAPPGAQELEFKLKNPDSMTAGRQGAPARAAAEVHRGAGGVLRARGPRHDDGRAGHRPGHDVADAREPARGAPHRRPASPPTSVVHALNQWMHEQWTFNFENRIFPTPVITLPIVDKAIEELEWVVERGAKAILVRPAPVPDFNDRRRSFALPEFDPFWQKVVEADVVVGMHASDSGFQRYVNEWEGHDGEFLPFNTKLSGVLPPAARRQPHDQRRRDLDHRPRPGDAVPGPAHHAGRERQRVGPPTGRQVPEGLRAGAEGVRRGPDGGVQALHLRPPVPRGGPDRPGEAHRRRQRALRVGLPPPRGHVRPDRLRRPARRARRRRQGQGHGRQPQPHHEGAGRGSRNRARGGGRCTRR